MIEGLNHAQRIQRLAHMLGHNVRVEVMKAKIRRKIAAGHPRAEDLKRRLDEYELSNAELRLDWRNESEEDRQAALAQAIAQGMPLEDLTAALDAVVTEGATDGG